MKEKKNTLLEKMKENKKQIGVVVILVLVLLLGVGGFGIYSMNSKDDAPKKSAQVEKKEPLQKPEKTMTTVDDKKTEQKEDTGETKKTEQAKQKEQEAKEEKKDTEASKQVTEATKPTVSKPSTSKPSTPTTQPVNPQPSKPQKPVEPQKPVAPQKPSHTHNFQPVYTQKWVVDQPAWTETVETPVYEMTEIHVGNQSGLQIQGDPNEYLLNNQNGDTGWHSEWVQVQTGTKTETIHHPEQGHYENVLSHSQCSCGAVK